MQSQQDQQQSEFARREFDVKLTMESNDWRRQVDTLYVFLFIIYSLMFMISFQFDSLFVLRIQKYSQCRIEAAIG
jgi:hypothetical protein